jgi:hypothetical protein
MKDEGVVQQKSHGQSRACSEGWFDRRPNDVAQNWHLWSQKGKIRIYLAQSLAQAL